MVLKLLLKFRSLTMFADYRVPQVLVFLNVLNYSPELLEELSSKKLIENGSETEAILRGYSIFACEVIFFAFKKIYIKKIYRKLLMKLKFCDKNF